ncbi:MAG TPA: IPT/TIG domain-containing protein, partial [Longimicrobiaceae bacterium]|nr:IPT/TIG domain-containing protein [Longimicrobiaceae bacterium]
MHTPHAIRPAGRGALAVLLLLAAACSDRSEPTSPIGPPHKGGPAVAALTCQASVARRTVECGTPVPSSGASLAIHTLGGQGTYVRIAATGVAYAGGVFSFDATVQNLSDLAFATADGATRHDDGVRVFFHSGPTATGGFGAITVSNETGTGAFTAADQPYFQYGGDIGGIDQGDLGAEGILASAETSTAKEWELAVPGTVTSFSFVLYVRTETPAGTIATVAPQVTGVSPATLVPGASATLTGINFDATPGDNTVTIGGVATTVTGGTGTTSLTVTVPCTASGTPEVQVAADGKKGAGFAHPLAVASHTLAEGEAVVLSDPADVACNEIAASGGTSDYIVAVYNTGSAPLTTTAFQLSGDADDAVAAPDASRIPAPRPARSARQPRPGRSPGLDALMAQARQQRGDELHYQLLEKNRAAHQRLRQRFAGDPRMRPSRDLVAAADPPATASFEVSDITSGDICDNSFTVAATRVYWDGKVAIYEDDANPITAAGNATLAGYYTAIGDQFNDDMEPVVTTNFADPLARDDVTDDNDVLIALFTDVINDNFPGVAGFVVSCDQYPNGVGNTASNFGEFFYALVPTSTTAGYGTSSTMDSWYWSIRATFIHETKHVAAQASRVAGGAAAFEASWLEEGMARHSEEMWAREEVYNVAWEANTGYGS